MKVYNRKSIFIFLTITIFLILDELITYISRLYPHILGSYSMWINYFSHESPPNIFQSLIWTISPAILMIAGGWYTKFFLQKLGFFSFASLFILSFLGDLTRIENSLWFRTLTFLPLIIALISFSLDLKEKHREQQ